MNVLDEIKKAIEKTVPKQTEKKIGYSIMQRDFMQSGKQKKIKKIKMLWV